MPSHAAASRSAGASDARFDPAAFIVPALAQLPVKDKTDYRGVVNLSSNESDLAGLRALFRRYLNQAPETCATRYPDWPTLLRETASFYGLPAAGLVMDAGSDSTIRAIAGLFGRACGSMVVQEPNYPNYRYYAALAGCELTGLRHPADHWDENIVDLARPLLAGRAPSVVVVTNPNGFTGSAIPLPEMERLCDLCAQGNHLLVIDEAYAPFATISHRSLLERYRGAMIVRSFSKCCGMAGLRLGLTIADEPLAAYLRRWCGVNAVSAMAAGCLSYCFAHADEVAAQRDRMEIVRAEVAAEVARLFPAWRSPPSAANFLLFDTGSAAVADALAAHLAARRIIVKHFPDGPVGLRACLRMTLGDREVMVSVLAGMRAFAATMESIR
ncbi:histidinol-phosphate aminotransferase [Paraburkholderia sp. Clong3]|uniref:aminotransferase class I/II-fold pyridoxal phosphate-dependent enzyme n=1 Tax=Paraburkholderia sp. Clong3 TaxID=2991061 RepID=UPI003D190C56